MLEHFSGPWRQKTILGGVTELLRDVVGHGIEPALRAGRDIGIDEDVPGNGSRYPLTADG